MYKLLVVDDEAAIRNGIVAANPWKEWGFEVVGQCANGIETLAFMEKLVPDIILSDIRMPQMDGIELMQILNRDYPKVKIVILSGYSDFEYLNMSIKNNVTEYLLKPTDMDEFQQVFLKMKKHLDEDTIRQQDIENLKLDYACSRGYQHAQWLNLLLRGHTEEAEAEQQRAELETTYKICFDNCSSVILSPDERLGDEDKELYLLKKAIVNFGNDFYSELGHHFFLTQEEEIVGLLSLPTEFELDVAVMNSFIQSLQKEISSVLGITISAGISNLCTELDMLPGCFEQAKCCARQNVFLGKESIVVYSQFADDLPSPNVCFNSQKLHADLLGGRFEGVQEELNRVFDNFANRSMRQYNYVDQICIEVLFNLSRWSLQHNVRFESVLASLGANYTDLYRCDTLEKKKTFIMIIFFAVKQELEKSQHIHKQRRSIAYQIRKCVDENYANNLISLEYVSEKVGKSPVYVSKVFKNELGHNFSEYIAGKRMEKSKEYLMNQALKIYEVSQLVGYVDTSNFIKVFRKHYGVSPNQYRISSLGVES